MYSGGSSRAPPGARGGGPKPDRLNVRRNCSFRLCSRLCMLMLSSCSSSDRSTTPPFPSPSPGAGRFLWWVFEIGLLCPQRGCQSSRMENSSSKVLELQMVPSWEIQMLAMGKKNNCTFLYYALRVICGGADAAVRQIKQFLNTSHQELNKKSSSSLAVGRSVVDPWVWTRAAFSQIAQHLFSRTPFDVSCDRVAVPVTAWLRFSFVHQSHLCCVLSSVRLSEPCSPLRCSFLLTLICDMEGSALLSAYSLFAVVCVYVCVRASF